MQPSQKVNQEEELTHLYINLFIFLFEHTSFQRVVRPIEKALIHLSLEEVAVSAGREVLMVVVLYSLIVGNPQGILDQQLSPHPIQLIIYQIAINYKL
jgi:hypothetical protein